MSNEIETVQAETMEMELGEQENESVIEDEYKPVEDDFDPVAYIEEQKAAKKLAEAKKDPNKVRNLIKWMKYMESRRPTRVNDEGQSERIRIYSRPGGEIYKLQKLLSEIEG